MTKLEEAYKNYTQTKTTFNEDGTMTETSPRGHYTNESIDDFKNKLLTDDTFNKQWSLGCTGELTEHEVIEYFYKNIRPEQKWCRDEKGRYFYYVKESNMWFEHSGSDVLWGMRPSCPKRKIIE